MAKKQGNNATRNTVLQTFLLELSVNNGLRRRFSEASTQEKRQLLSSEFKIGDKTIDALLSGIAGRVKARLRFSDQQGTPLKRSGRSRKTRVKKTNKR